MNKKFFKNRSTLYTLHSAVSHNRGAALTIAVLFFIVISLAIVLGSVNPVVRDFSTGNELVKSKLSYATAEAGDEDAIYRVKKGKQISSPEVTTLNGGSVSVSVTDTGTGEKQITANGNISNYNRNVQTTIDTGVGIDFAYGAQVGEGGLVMGNNATISGTGGVAGNVYSNGPISGSNGATVTGVATVATSVTQDANWEVCNQDQVVGQTNPQIDFAEQFQAGASQPLYKVSLYIKKVGNPSNPTIIIVADSSGTPGSTALSSSGLSSSLVTGSYGWVDVTFSNPANLTSGQNYWIIFDASQNSSNYYVWCKDSNNGYGNGIAKYRQSWNSGSAWSSPITGDLNFITYVGGGPGIITNVNISQDAHANTITNSTIGGTAYCQTGSGNNKTCNTSQADPSPLSMPISQGNINQWESDATAGGVIAGNCPGTAGCGTTMGPKKIVGNLTVNSTTLTLTGVLYVTGNISVTNNGTIKCDVSFGTNSCVVVADGWIDISNNGIFAGSGQSGSYVLAVSTISGCNGGSQTSSCATNNSGINISNNVDGGIFYTEHSMININNNAEVKEITGYKLSLSNNTEIQYEQGVANANFSSGPSGGWNVKTWNEVQ
jgi:hypothetical protein